MTDSFYRFTEEINYASEEDVFETRKFYLPFVKCFTENGNKAKAVDLGCGRGEWLQLLTDHGFVVSGVDIDNGMLQAAREKGFDVTLGDLLGYLESLADDSISVLSAFHVLEHIPFEDIQVFFKEAMRVLVPGGVLIAETPNPENIDVANSIFYLDHTHLRPIPIMQMITLARYYKFEQYGIFRLRENKDLYNDCKNVAVSDLIYGVSKDYALVAQKKGNEFYERALVNPLKYQTGISLLEVAKKLDLRINSLENLVTETERRLILVEEKLSSFDKWKDRFSKSILRLFLK